MAHEKWKKLYRLANRKKLDIFFLRSLVATDDIAKDEEIFVQYNYPIGNPGAQKWYKEMYEEEVGPWPTSPQQ